MKWNRMRLNPKWRWENWPSLSQAHSKMKIGRGIKSHIFININSSTDCKSVKQYKVQFYLILIMSRIVKLCILDMKRLTLFTYCSAIKWTPLGGVHKLRLQEEGGRWSKKSIFCKPLYHRRCKRRGVGGQKKPNLVNVVCERPFNK